jgi:DNA polymerase III subunit delta
MYENQVGEWIKRVLQGRGYSIEPKAMMMFVEFLGNDLSRIANELTKLEIILPKGSTITPAHIEENIGFSKDFNVFEFRKAIGEKNQFKAYQIADYFSKNQKDNPLVMTTGLVFSFFSQLLQYHGLKDKSQGNVAKILKVNPYFVSDYITAAKNYPMKKVSSIIATLRSVDVKSKGVGANALPQADLLKEMLVSIFN